MIKKFFSQYQIQTTWLATGLFLVTIMIISTLYIRMAEQESECLLEQNSKLSKYPLHIKSSYNPFNLISPSYKNKITVTAIQHAFLEIPLPESREPCLPYGYQMKWSRLLDIYRVRLHRLAIQEFQWVRENWRVDEQQYQYTVDWYHSADFGRSR